MNVAICVSGIFRGSQQGIRVLREHFTAPVFQLTWDGKEPIGFQGGLVQEPEIQSHPIEDNALNQLTRKLRCYAKKMHTPLRERTLHQTKQILAHDAVLRRIPLKYDTIIRIRPDTVLLPTADYQGWARRSLAETKAIGVGTRISRHDDISRVERVPRKKDPPAHESQDWWRYVMDPLIFHPRALWDSARVADLHASGLLLPAEYGWWQVLSEPFGDTHECYYGAAQIEKYMRPKDWYAVRDKSKMRLKER